MNMVKFPSKGDEGYKRTLGHIDDIRNAQRPEIQQGMSRNELSLIWVNDRFQVSEPTPSQGNMAV